MRCEQFNAYYSFHVKCACFLSVLPAAVQKEVEGKAMDCIIRVTMSPFAFHDGIIIYNYIITRQRVCEILFASHEVVTVRLDCSSDIPQIKVKANIQAPLLAKGGNAVRAHVCARVCARARVRRMPVGLHTHTGSAQGAAGPAIWGVHILSGCSPMMLCFIFFFLFSYVEF